MASADILRTHNGKKSLTDDVFVGLDGNEQSIGITPFAPTLRNESYEARRQTYLKAIENLLGIKRGILSDAEVVSKTATEINSSAGDYSLSIMDFQHLYYDALQAALRLGDQIGQAYRLCDASAWDADELAVYLAQRIYSSLSSVLKCRASALSAMPERCLPVRRCLAIPKRMPRAGLRL